jgi:hypothetical protein
MKPKKEKEWYRTKGLMQLFKSDKLIREYRYNDSYNRRRIYKIWMVEIKPNGIDEYYLLIKPEVKLEKEVKPEINPLLFQCLFHLFLLFAFF